MSIQSLENVGLVVQDLEAAIAFFGDLGLTLLGQGPVEGSWADRVVGLEGVRSDIAMMQTPDGHGRLELISYRAPAALPGDPVAPPNTLGLHRIAFAVDDLDAALASVRSHGAELVGEIVRFEDSHRLCYLRGPEGIIVMLSEQLG